MGGEAGFDCLPQGLIKNCLPVLPLRAAEAIHRRTETLSPLHQDHFFCVSAFAESVQTLCVVGLCGARGAGAGIWLFDLFESRQQNCMAMFLFCIAFIFGFTLLYSYGIR